MSKHGPIAAGPDERPRPARGPSLIERAANVYDFRASLRGTPDTFVEPPRADAAPVAPAPFRPAAANRMGTVALAALEEGGFILPGRKPTALSEEFRVVKRQLLADDDGLARSILVCSARPDEGKTFCAINLAISLAAERDIEVLLVDADVAKPEIVATLGLEDGCGLLDAIADPAVDVEGCVIRTDVPRLSVLPAGGRTHEATELLSSARTRDVLDRLRGGDPRRVIVFDSPPALAASQAGVLAMHCGQALFVVRAEQTSEADIREALGLVSACPKPRLLLNGVEFGASSRRFGRYYGADA
ncbi:exopolysaccharide biosynthesis protein [Sphingomonas sp.]|uniref:exopolysaccharide biosynthesis protein n=1 Tax=Sphingomonas sp. TaxID=28214 RepID=UPI003AFFC241